MTDNEKIIELAEMLRINVDTKHETLAEMILDLMDSIELKERVGELDDQYISTHLPAIYTVMHANENHKGRIENCENCLALAKDELLKQQT